ncbi:MAG TPA: hypothetical protein VF219_08540 [Vicinamibacterales bacterium]
MKKILVLMLVSVALLQSQPAKASAYERVLCPPFVGTFHTVGRTLMVTIVKENDKVVPPRTVDVANPPGAKEADALVRRGPVQFNAHVDKEKGGAYFVHWDTLKSQP